METSLKDRLEIVEERIARAAARAGRNRADITLIAVTKVFPADAILEAYALGLRHFGENYVQEFEGKHPRVAHLGDACFHLIGHLQSNKSRRAVELFQAIDTVDTAKLAARLDQQAPAAPAPPIDVMLEVNVAGEGAKSGVASGDLGPLVEAVRACPRLRLRGLMTMPPWSDEAEPSRVYFCKLRELAREHGVEGLSMGMSHDLEVAIEEGATAVRVGTALFGRRRPKP